MESKRLEGGFILGSSNIEVNGDLGKSSFKEWKRSPGSGLMIPWREAEMAVLTVNSGRCLLGRYT